MMDYREINQLTIEEALPLYTAVGWTNYTKNPDTLAKGLQQSLYLLAAYDGEQLVGLLRAVGDGVTIVFIQDILVLPDYQRQGIGRTLMTITLERFSGVYQCHLLTDQTEKTRAFYTSLGFKEVSEQACAAYTFVN
ncbi:GNAT family N-acetyltransferase [Streptococcus entericus]|uniref:GNAT family N-acetyltransferase n=1 Tax=Streptococcus entericus TaxID=155680 RepID=UPI00047764ED|nr:GNAT family N-acetyltransferase [Streptococcus entericus]